MTHNGDDGSGTAIFVIFVVVAIIAMSAPVKAEATIPFIVETYVFTCPDGRQLKYEGSKEEGLKKAIKFCGGSK